MQKNKNKYPIFLLPTDETNYTAPSLPPRNDQKMEDGGNKKGGGGKERGILDEKDGWRKEEEGWRREEESWKEEERREDEGGRRDEEGDAESCVPGLNNKGKIVNYWLCFILGIGMEFFAFFSHPDKFALWFLLGNIINLGG